MTDGGNTFAAIEDIFMAVRLEAIVIQVININCMTFESIKQ